MNALLSNLAGIGMLSGWVIGWAFGGIWLLRASFNLRENEQVITGVGLGLVLETWLANLLAQVLPVPAAFWAASAGIFLAGFLFSLAKIRREGWLCLIRLPLRLWQWVAFFALFYVLYLSSRGLGIQDDFQNLPIISVMATGDIPPHFPLNPSITFGYHYLTMLFGAQLMRLGDLFVWSALDMARSVGFAFSIIIGALFVQRVTNSRLAGYVAAILGMFGGGARWLLLLLPPSLVSAISSRVQLMGSGANSGTDLASALLNRWMVAGEGPYPFPFAFVNGFNATGVMIYQAGGGSLPAIMGGFVLLSHNRWRGWRAWVVMSILMAASFLGNEASALFGVVGFAVAALIWMILKKKIRLPIGIWRWIVVIGVGGLISLFQGGVISALALNVLGRFIPALATTEAYHTFSFSFFWPPALLSSHLGYLSLTDPYQLLVAICETGPMILLLPLVIVWCVKAFRYRRWYEAAMILSALVSIPTAFIQLSGASGPTALTRVQVTLVGLCGTFGVPALWLWVRHRSNKLKISSLILFFIAIFGGVVLFGIQLIAAQRPIFADYLNYLDAKMAAHYWNKLPADVWVFDPLPYRAPTVLGRDNDSSYDYFKRKPEWDALVENPDPVALNAAGYHYAYFGLDYWRELAPEAQERLLDSGCVLVVETLEQEFPKDQRWLLDISNCH